MMQRVEVMTNLEANWRRRERSGRLKKRDVVPR
jgi:hypothetical protein